MNLNYFQENANQLFIFMIFVIALFFAPELLAQGGGGDGDILSEIGGPIKKLIVFGIAAFLVFVFGVGVYVLIDGAVNIKKDGPAQFFIGLLIVVIIIMVGTMLLEKAGTAAKAIAF